ncbi:hypothetical protein M2M59_01160 [Rummeliibacillus sp. G93]|uniref:Uncharacterized protein n=1 Tax=Rummeliibacillus stabekisii TaxID=241244 RepID=A0A143HGE1_9BACL|nr:MULTISPECIES: SE1832 family protein [Rummeliibacillus]AMX00799.1 hypothetical protein ATY39_16295 [Rummeliibacillus stabekisii]MBB5170612.1 putative nuclease with TOPRIM domain [Rummeliibacillus stabekisii]MCM3315115.1 hypothetical protein [Rummeliibacillus stabekisii]UQW97644.1 hypothetical protein M2M59_01160 [Rummeliibacillus sp. G93]GEL04868.1 hypothetical protein RST01_14950 [Rummeliibacillus stabekisii]
MATKEELLYTIAELKSDYIRQQGDIEKLEATGYPQMVEKAEQRLADMEQQLAELNKKLESYEA